MRIDKIYAENFQAYSTLSLSELSQHNTFLLLGDNGAGKSSILEVVVYNIYGISMRDNKSDLVNINSEQMVTKCTYLLPKGKLVIERGMKSGSAFLNVWFNGKDVGLRKIGDTENVILSKYIPISANLFKKSHLFRANILEEETDKTAKLSIADLIEELFSVNELEAYKKTARDFRLTLDHSFKKGIVNVNQYLSQIKKLKRIKEDAQEEVDSLIDEKSKIIDDQSDELHVLLDKQKKYNEKIKQIEEKLSSLKEKKRKGDSKYMKIESEINQHRKNYKDNKKIYDLDVCPFCKQEISTEKKKELSGEMDKVKNMADHLKKEMEEIQKKVDKINDTISKGQEKYNNGKSKIEKINSRIYFLKSNIENLKEEIDKLKAKASSTTKVDEEINSIRKRLKRVIGAMTHNSYFYETADKLVKMLSEGSEFRYFFINLDGFNSIAQKYVDFFNLKFDVRLEVNDKSKIVPIITPQYSSEYTLKFAQLSQGQKRKTVLVLLMSIISFLLNDNKHLQILFFDEVLDSLDIEGVDSVIRYVNMLKEHKDIQSFFISHSHLSKIVNNDYFDKIYWISQNEVGISELTEFNFNDIEEQDIEEALYGSTEFAKSGISKKDMKAMSKEEKFRLVLNYELLREVM